MHQGVNARPDALANSHAGKEGADNGRDPGVHGKQPERKEKTDRQSKLRFRNAQPFGRPGHKMAHGARTPMSNNNHKGAGENSGEDDIQGFDLALGEAADDSQNEQSKHVIDHGSGKNNATGLLPQKSVGGKDLSRD